MGEWLRRELQCAPTRRAAQWRDLLRAARGSDHHRELAAASQRDPSACLSRIQTPSTRGVRASIRRVAGFATCSGSAGYPSAETHPELTFSPGPSVGANQPRASQLKQTLFIFYKRDTCLRLEKIGSFYQNHRSNIPPDSAFTYGLINKCVPLVIAIKDRGEGGRKTAPAPRPRRHEPMLLISIRNMSEIQPFRFSYPTTFQIRIIFAVGPYHLACLVRHGLQRRSGDRSKSA